MKITPNDIEKLVTLGKFYYNPYEGLLLYFKNKEYLNHFDNFSWKEILLNVSDLDLIYIYKGLVTLERILEWNGGSVAASIWVYRIIQNRRLDLDFSLADFGLRNCCNPWVPFGSSYYGERNINAFLEHKKISNALKRKKAGKYEMVIKRVKGRKLKRAKEIAALRNIPINERIEFQNSLRERYKNSNVLEKLSLIANDKDYPPEYYPKEWIYIDIDEIRLIPEFILKKLVDKLTTKSRGEWKRFKEKLQKFDDGV